MRFVGKITITMMITIGVMRISSLAGIATNAHFRETARVLDGGGASSSSVLYSNRSSIGQGYDAGISASATFDNYSGFLAALMNIAPVILQGTNKIVYIEGFASSESFLGVEDPDLWQTLSWTLVEPPDHGDVDILPATGTNVSVSYTPQYDNPLPVVFTVQVSDGEGGIDQFVYDVTMIPLPSNNGRLTFDGELMIGYAQVANPGNWNGIDLSYDYQWQNSVDGENWSDIEGSMRIAHRLEHEDNGKYLRVKLDVTEHGYAVPATVTEISEGKLMNLRPIDTSLFRFM